MEYNKFIELLKTELMKVCAEGVKLKLILYVRIMIFLMTLLLLTEQMNVSLQLFISDSFMIIIVMVRI